MGLDRLPDALEKGIIENNREEKKGTWKALVQIGIALAFLFCIGYMMLHIQAIINDPCEVCMKTYNLSCYNFANGISISP